MFNGEERRLYRETRFVKTTTKKDAGNSPIYGQEKEDLSCFMLHEDAEFTKDSQKQLSSEILHKELDSNKIWKCYFDGAYSKDGTEAGFLFISPEGNLLPFSFKLEFESTNNATEYEALILSIQTTKQMGIQCISIFGDSELIIRQIKNLCQTKHPKLRSYRNEVWDWIENYFEALNRHFIQEKKTEWKIH